MRPTERVHGRAGVTATILGSVAATVLVFASLASASDRGVLQVPFTVRGSAQQVELTGAKPGQRLKLVDGNGNVVQTKTAGSLGGIVYRRVAPGGGYRVRESGGAESPKFKVLTDRPAPPNTKIYNQTLPAGGYGYLTTRDGTKLAIDVHLPGPANQGPYPTLVEYSGYGYADPSGPQSSIQPIAQILGFAVVDVNMRGTGCSGGAFDYFERLQSLDGYDVVETVARQPWVLHGKVGMMGVSYGGISQLFVGQTQPAAPGRDRAALGDRQHARRRSIPAASSTRASPSVGRGPRARRRARVARPAARPGRTSRSRTATRSARPTRTCTPRRST